MFTHACIYIHVYSCYKLTFEFQFVLPSIFCWMRIVVRSAKGLLCLLVPFEVCFVGFTSSKMTTSRASMHCITWFSLVLERSKYRFYTASTHRLHSIYRYCRGLSPNQWFTAAVSSKVRYPSQDIGLFHISRVGHMLSYCVWLRY